MDAPLNLHFSRTFYETLVLLTRFLFHAAKLMKRCQSIELKMDCFKTLIHRVFEFKKSF